MQQFETSYEYAPMGTMAAVVQKNAAIARLHAYIALQERLIEAARRQDDKMFLALLPEYDFRRLTVYERPQHTQEHADHKE